MRYTTLVVLLMAPAGGCLAEHHSTLDCGPGASFPWAGADYCMYDAAIIIEGFDCPPDAPFRHDMPDAGVTICSPTGDAPTGGWQALVDAWKNGTTPGADAVDASPGEVDATPAPQSVCDKSLASLAVGSPVEAAGSSCTVARLCDEGLVAQCGLGPMAVDCLWGDVRAVPIASTTCPARHAALGDDCVAGLGADACAAGLFCDASARCATLPELCSRACFGDVDCSGACAGGSLLEGVVGLCLERPAVADCWDPNDCPGGWSCVGADRACAPCNATCSNSSVAGHCHPAAYTALGLFQAPGGVAPAWNVGDAYALLDCPAYRLEVRDEATGEWVVGPLDATCSGTSVVASNETIPFAVVPVDPDASYGYAWVRARGRFWSGCAGSRPDTCQSGPTEVVSEPILVLP